MTATARDASDWDEEPAPSYRPVFATALTAALCVFAAFGGWAMYARLDGAVTTQGVVLAESRRKTVENLEGGILSRLLVQAGDRVEAGQEVALLDVTQEREQLARLAAQREGLAFDIWRLEAETRAADRLDPAAAPPQAAAREDRIADQIALFDARRAAHLSQIASLQRQTEALSAQAKAAEGQARAAERQIESWRAERANTAALVERGAAPAQKLRELDRAVAVLEGDRDEQHGLAAAMRGDMARAEADIATLREQRQADAGGILAEARRGLAGVEAQIRGIEDVLRRRTLRAPQAGLVVDIPNVTPGSVIGSGTPVMEIVPEDDALVVQIRLPPDAIDTVYPGRPAKVRLTAYRRATAPVIAGEVTYVSADLLEDPRDGARYFDARVTLDEAALAAHADVSVTPGMPVEVAVQTGERRAGDYLLEPVLRHLRRAMREE